MGHRVTQVIYRCDKCGVVPEEGENLWYMGAEIWCEACCDREEQEGGAEG